MAHGEGNGHWDPEVIESLKLELRDITEKVDSFPAIISRVQGEGITTRAALSHLGVDVRHTAQRVEFYGGKLAELAAMQTTAIQNQHATERMLIEFIAEWRAAQP